MNNLIIGIAGGSGSGKTTLAIRLKERFGEDEVRLISHDSYYKRHDELPFAERCKLNYDHPDAFDNDLLIEHLQELKAGRAIDCPVYDYADHNRSSEVQHIEPAPVLIVEGILPLAEPELCKLFDYKIYVDTDADERILRRILRDVKERGRSLDSVITQYRATVKPMHEAFVEPSKRNADIIIPNGGGAAVVMVFACISGASAPQRGCGSDNSASLRCCEGWRRAGPSVPRSCPHPRPEARHCPE